MEKQGSTKLEENIDKKYKEAKELPPADIKLILLGDSAVGKSKYPFLFHCVDWLKGSC